MSRSRGRGPSGVSAAVDIRYGAGIGRRSRTASHLFRDAPKRRVKAQQQYRERVAGFDYVQREAAAQMDVDMEGWEDDPLLFPIPPGDEGVLASHAGGEEELCRGLFKSRRKRHDGRTRRDRTTSRNAQWASQIPQLINGYLAWKHQGSPDDAECHRPNSQDAEPPLSRTSSPSSVAPWSLLVFKVNTSSVRSFTPANASELPNVTLARYGSLGVAPLLPSIAISFQVLEAYRQLHGACPRLSVQAFCRVLCGLHQVLFRTIFAEQFSIAFDVYLDILHGVDSRVDVLLSHDTPEWHMLNACAPCLYRLEDEPPLEYDLLVAVNGNSSLKLIDDAFRGSQQRPDHRTARTDLIILPEEVDRFKDDVASANKQSDQPSGGPRTPFDVFPFPRPVSGPATLGDEQDDTVIDSKETAAAAAATVVEEPSESQSVCAERWRNAGPEARKKMFALFAITGIFVCVCRHGHVLVMCDMVRSGELMKYGIVIVDKLVTVYGPQMKIKLGYDIGCEFNKSLKSSSVGPHATNVSMVVPAFHGHSHNRACQVQWHPMYMSGVGKEDFEGCERFFSASNGLAPGTRLSTPFHRHQAIEGRVTFWAADKHAESGKFIFHNYRQALRAIEDGVKKLEIYERDLKTTAEDYERYYREECEYLRGLKSEPPEVSLKFEYVQALQELEQAGIADRAIVEKYKSRDILLLTEQITKRQYNRIEKQYVNAQTAFIQAEEKVRRLEDVLDLDARWLPTSAEYKAVSAEVSLREYRSALDNLERLVVQRMFELKKLGMNGLGYKLREKIGQALKTRAEAIRNALAAYNKRAAALSLPRSQLNWTQIMNMVSVGEFDLLRDARQDIRSKPWAQASHREAMNVYFDIKRCREEISRLNVEIARLFSSMVDDHVDLTRAADRVRQSDPTLVTELEARRVYLNIINSRIVSWLQKASRLAGFSGKLVYGHRVGHEKALVEGVDLPPWAARLEAQDGGAQSEKDRCSEDADGDDDENENDDDLEDGEGIPGAGGAGSSNQFVDFVDGL
ncbi:hypothetical protein BV20DRAFT_1056040 [Pilatotrama ljubarskyi]|nr:hypothetical protein BV20DRAFT_1056040 [Pilatotrama ljubarskyi]